MFLLYAMLICMQAMLTSAGPGSRQFCFGSLLILEQWMLTASRCVDSASASDIVVKFMALFNS